MRNLLFVVTLFSHLTATTAKAADNSTKNGDEQSWLRVSISSKSLYNSELEGGLDLVHSHLRAKIGNQDLKEVIENFNRKSSHEQVRNIVEFSLAISGAPYLIGDRTLTQLEQKVDHHVAEFMDFADKQIASAKTFVSNRLSEVRAQTFAQLPAMVAAELNKTNPIVLPPTATTPPLRYLSLPASMKALVQKKALSLAVPEVERRLAAAKALADEQIRLAENNAYQKIREGRQEKLREISDRLERIQMETALQEIAIRYGHINRKGTGVVYLQFGKFMPETGPKTNSEGQSYIEDLRPENDFATRLNGSSPTGAVGVGFATYLTQASGDQVKFRTDVYVFHERIPLQNASDYLSNLIQLPQDEFDDHTRFWELNTGLLRVMVETKRVTAYLTGAAGEKHSWVGAGIDYEFTSKSRLIVNAYKGDRASAKEALSVYVTRELNASTTVYIGTSYIKKRRSPVAVEIGEYDETRVMAGANVHLRNSLFGMLAEPKVSVELYGEKRDSYTNRSEKRDSEMGYGVMASIQAKWGYEAPSEKIARLEREIRMLNEEFSANEQSSQKNPLKSSSGAGKLEKIRVKLEKKLQELSVARAAQNACATPAHH